MLVLVDTSIWIDHFRERDEQLVALLEEGRVATHPFVIGELACGNLGPQRRDVLEFLSLLPATPMAAQTEVLALIEQRQLAAKGIGWVDAHLLAAALLAGHQLWTRDKRLLAAAADIAQAPLLMR